MTLFYYTFVFLLGASIGSFINVVVYRTHKNISIIFKGSFCPKCKKSINWYDNVPVIGYMLLGGKCRFCKKKISIQYPIVEAVTGLLFLFSFILHIGNLETATLLIARDWIFISFLIIIFIYDLKWYLILDRFSITLIIVAIIINLMLGVDILDLFYGLIAGGGIFLLQFVVSKGKWIGGGDIRLGAAMGAILGLKGVLVALFIAYILGSVIGIGLLLLGKKQWGSKVPFGTFLVPATIIALFFQQAILDWYFSFL